jgi:hypothetical protein
METAARHRFEQLRAVRSLVVPRERDLTHQIRVRANETAVPFEDFCQT